MDSFIKDLLDTCQVIVGLSAIPGDPKLFHVADEVNNPILHDNLRELFPEVAFLTKRVLAPQRGE
jgi:hypothetical protein